MSEMTMCILAVLMLICMLILGGFYANHAMDKIRSEYTEPDDWPGDWAIVEGEVLDEHREV